MKIRTLDGSRLHRGFSAGALNVRARQEVLNSMNVFPVPDGDTGTNLAATVQSVSEETVVSRSLSETSASMADAALMGARGNSGLSSLPSSSTVFPRRPKAGMNWTQRISAGLFTERSPTQGRL